MHSSNFADMVMAAAAQGTSCLKEAVSANRYHLDCNASDGSACPVHATGHVFAAYFIADAIADALSSEEKRILTGRMDAECRGGVWGYMLYAPVDSDDTTFVIRTYKILGREMMADSLLRFYDKEGQAFTTFDGRGKASLVFEPSVINNHSFHPEVNANIFSLLADTPLSCLIHDEIILRAQTDQGDWRSYFYPGSFYATYMSLSLLCKTGRQEDARNKGIAFLRRSQNADGSWGKAGGPYETSLAINALAACGVLDSVFKKGIFRLLAQQSPDGTWKDETIVIWAYTYSQKPLVIWRAYDTGGVVTTALAVKALRTVREKQAP